MPYEVAIFKANGNSPQRIERCNSAIAVLRCQTPSQLGEQISQAFKGLTATNITVGPLYVENGTKRRLTDEEEREVLKAGRNW